MNITGKHIRLLALVAISAILVACPPSTLFTDLQQQEKTGGSGGKTYAIGSTGPGGGIVFYDSIAATGSTFQENGVTCTYLEAAPTDQGDTNWYGTGGFAILGASGTAIGTGATNTATIVADEGAGGYAAALCKSLSLGGYTDWFLPSQDELNQMYLNLYEQGLGGFSSTDFYWSSSEDSANPTDWAWVQLFQNGSQSGNSKGDNNLVRAVRAF